MKSKLGARSIKSNFSGIAIAMAVAQVFFSADAYAQGGVERTYNIASGPLDRTLVEIAQSSKARLSYDASLVQSLKSAPVDGTYTPEEAIRHALVGTGLKLESTPSGTLTITKVSSGTNASVGAAAASAAVPASGASSPAAANSSAVDTTLPLISVQAQYDSGGTGYVAESSSSYARTDTPISLTAKSIQVVNAAVIQSQNDQSLSDILRNSSGINTYPGPYGLPSFSIRGFGVSSSQVLTGGVQGAGSIGGAAGLTPSVAIQSVEVLKGPSAILAGDAPPGGAINIVVKSPQADPFHELQLGYGKYGNLTAAFDSTGAITTDKQLMYRFVVSGQKVGQNDSGYDGYRNSYFAPTLEWKDSKTDVKLSYTHSVTDNPFPSYTMGYKTGGFAKEYFTTPLGTPSDGFKNVANDVSLKITHQLFQGLDIVSLADWSQSHGLQVGWTPLTTISATGGAPFMSFDTSSDAYAVNFQNYLRLKKNFGDLKTVSITGIDYRQTHETDYYNGGGGHIFQVPNVFAPPVFPSSTGAFASQGSTTFRSQDVAFYGQEQISYQRWHFLGSVREDVYSLPPQIVNVPGRTILNAPPGLHQRAFTPNLGLLYQLTDDIAAYANWNKGFQPNSGNVFGGGFLPPQISEQVEAGMKFNLLDDKLNLTTSTYRISYTNQIVADPTHPGFSLSAGGAVSRGFEFDVQGEILPGLSVIGNYTYNDYVQAYNPTVNVALPKNSASLWTTYNLQMAALRGFGVGLGLYFQGSQSVGGTSSLYHLPSQLETDVGVFYRQKKWGANLTVKNIFNRNLYYSSTNPDYIPMGTSRSLLLTATYDF